MRKSRQLKRLLHLMLLAGVPHIATAMANCPNGNIQSIDLKGFKSAFTQRYCINPNKASCIRKWNNFMTYAKETFKVSYAFDAS
jgi:hypothetical protein